MTLSLVGATPLGHQLMQLDVSFPHVHLQQVARDTMGGLEMGYRDDDDDDAALPFQSRALRVNDVGRSRRSARTRRRHERATLTDPRPRCLDMRRNKAGGLVTVDGAGKKRKIATVEGPSSKAAQEEWNPTINETVPGWGYGHEHCVEGIRQV